MVYSGFQSSNNFGLPDLDLMDFPISGNSVCLAGSMDDRANPGQKIYVTNYKGNKFVMSKCAFCQHKLCHQDKIIQLPCSHSIHYSCVKKWTIIANPCRKCHQKWENHNTKWFIFLYLLFLSKIFIYQHYFYFFSLLYFLDRYFYREFKNPFYHVSFRQWHISYK